MTSNVHAINIRPAALLGVNEDLCSTMRTLTTPALQKTQLKSVAVLHMYCIIESTTRLTTLCTARTAVLAFKSFSLSCFVVLSCRRLGWCWSR